MLTLESANFSTDDACEALAKLVDVASKVTTFNIKKQNMDRPVRIVVDPATDEASTDGSISINDFVTNEIIYSMPTARTSALNVDYGDVYSSMTFNLNA